MMKVDANHAVERDLLVNYVVARTFKRKYFQK